MGMGSLGTFEPQSQIEGDRLQAQDVANARHPLLVNIVDDRDLITTKYKPEGGPGVYLDILDLSTQETFIHVLWMNGTVVDNLRPHVGETLPIRLVWRDSKKPGGSPYVAIEALTPEEIAVAQQWVDARPNLFDDARRAREIPTAEEIRAGNFNKRPASNGIPAMAQSAAAPTPPPAPTAPPVASAPAATPPAPPAAPPTPPAPAAATPPAPPAAPAPAAPPAPPAAPAPAAPPAAAAPPAPPAAPPAPPVPSAPAPAAPAAPEAPAPAPNSNLPF